MQQRQTPKYSKLQLAGLKFKYSQSKVAYRCRVCRRIRQQPEAIKRPVTQPTPFHCCVEVQLHFHFTAVCVRCERAAGLFAFGGFECKLSIATFHFQRAIRRRQQTNYAFLNFLTPNSDSDRSNVPSLLPSRAFAHFGFVSFLFHAKSTNFSCGS